MFGATKSHKTESIAFVLVPKFSMSAFTAAVEPLRLANWVSGKPLYEWQVLSMDGLPVTASCHVDVVADEAVGNVDFVPTVAVCSGIDVQGQEDAKLFAWLRRLAARGADIGALCTASHLLARAGLLDGYRCTIHWENLPGFAEEFPHLDVTSDIFEIDRNRFTCSGGTAALDLMLKMIAVQNGYELAAAVSDELIYQRMRDQHDHQRMNLRQRLGIAHPKLLEVIGLMEQNIEQPLSQRALAQQVDLSTRQLERLFQKYLHRTPTRYYLELRLNHARQLLMQTSLSVLSVAVACGFVSASHFSKCYREHFGRTPREERRVPA
ncbi:MAG: GlxA family transcriptional regulator [Alphaproteobacteria bacterium]|nr:GlxA family transcriptional regulator [Alphaproteobacteria bacterium]